MEETVTLREAGDRLGVDGATLKRLIRTGDLPEARKDRRDNGSVWVIPTDQLHEIATRNGWTIDLRHETTAVYPNQAPPASTPAASTPVLSTPAAKPSDGMEELEAKPEPSLASGQAPEPGKPAEAVEVKQANSSTQTAKPSGPPAPTAKTDTAKTDIAKPDTAAATAKADTAKPDTAKQDTAAATAKTGAAKPDTGTATAKPHAAAATAKADAVAAASKADEQRSAEIALAEIVDAALLDRLLGAHEEKAEAVMRSNKAEESLSELETIQRQTAELLEVERRERAMALDRFRQEQTARFVADAKVAELRDRLVREMAAGDSEKQSRIEASRRSLRAERDAANAVASMGWMSRRRYRRLTQT